MFYHTSVFYTMDFAKIPEKLLTNYYPDSLYCFFVFFRYTYCKAVEKDFKKLTNYYLKSADRQGKIPSLN